MENDIAYLIKFVTKYEHAKDMIDGKLYMRTANFYRTRFESDSKDPYEGSVSHSQMIFKGTNHYIFSTYFITRTMIKENASIPEKLIKHFGCLDGYIVLIKFDCFCILLQNSNEKTFSLTGFKISYGSILNINLTKELILDETFKSLSIKPKKYTEENEYRFVSGNASNDDDIPYVLNIGHSLISCAKIFNIKLLLKSKNKIKINELLKDRGGHNIF